MSKRTKISFETILEGKEYTIVPRDEIRKANDRMRGRLKKSLKKPKRT